MEGVFPRRGPKECGQNKVPTLGARGINFERTESILTLREAEADQKNTNFMVCACEPVRNRLLTF